MSSKLQEFIRNNKLYLAIGGSAVVLCLVAVIGFFALSNTGGKIDKDNSQSSKESTTGNSTTSSQSVDTTESTETDTTQSDTISQTTAGTTPNNTSKIPAVIGSTIYGADKSKNGYNPFSIVGVDNLGRTFGSLSSEKKDKQVGMFFCAGEGLGEPELAMGVYDNQKIIAMANGLKLLTDPKFLDPEISPVWQPHFWAEPIWGYYRGRDQWVIRRQLEMMAIAQVDFLVFDFSNGIPEGIENFSDPNNVYTRFMKTVIELQNEGWDVPKIAYMTHSRSTHWVNQLYTNLYKKGLYKDSWYMVNGKPFIIGYTNLAEDLEEAKSRGDSSYKPTAHSNEIKNYFYWRESQWPQETFRPNGFPWMEWSYPAPVHNGIINVTPAAHPGVPMSFSLTRPGWTNWGRGWDPLRKRNISADINKGTYYQSTWDVALKSTASTVFIGQWNEWTSMKQLWDGEYMFADEVDPEYSRDIEPMVGGFEDNYYMQTIQNIRKFKGVSGSAPGTKKTINIKSSASQWSDVTTTYRSIGTTGLNRDSFGVSDTITYKQAAPRNNLQEVKMSNDGSNLYVYIRAEKALTLHDGKATNWMNVLIGTGTVSNKGWKGYEYVINRNPTSSGKTSIHKLDSSGKGTKVGDAEYTIDGNVMQIKIPLSTLGAAAKKNVYFKVADNVDKPQDIMSYYTTGKSLPLGRVSYEYSVK